jgi:hypothetical protein
MANTFGQGVVGTLSAKGAQVCDRGQEPGVLVARHADELVEPADELLATELRVHVDGALRPTAVAHCLPGRDPAFPDERLDRVVQRAGVDLEAAVLEPFAQRAGDLVRVQGLLEQQPEDGKRERVADRSLGHERITGSY